MGPDTAAWHKCMVAPAELCNLPDANTHPEDGAHVNPHSLVRLTWCMGTGLGTAKDTKLLRDSLYPITAL